MKKRKTKRPMTHARAIRLSPKNRMKLSIHDMPKYPGKNACMVGEMRDYYPDGTYRSRWTRDGDHV